MPRMFCTLKQAADRLGTTEAQIEIWLSNGTLREFRDGSDRLLKISDLAAVASVARPAKRRRQTSYAQHEPTQAKRRRPNRAAPVPDAETRLPRSAVVATAPRPRPHRTGSPADPARDGSLYDLTAPLERESPAALPCDGPFSPIDPPGIAQQLQPRGREGVPWRPRRVFAAAPGRKGRTRVAKALPAQRRQRQPHEMSLRQWLWMGLLDDQPFAILLLLATVLLVVGSAAGAVYLLLHAL
jgi:hypothetical protein